MNLQALSPSCWSNRYVLKLDGNAWGEYRGRWFSENVDIRLTGRQQLVLRKEGLLGQRFALRDAADGKELALARRAGWFTSAWELQLSNGPAWLISAGWFNTAYRVTQRGRLIGAVDRVGLCNGGWSVQHDGEPAATDLLLLGMIYHTILRRNAAMASTTAS